VVEPTPSSNWIISPGIEVKIPKNTGSFTTYDEKTRLKNWEILFFHPLIMTEIPKILGPYFNPLFCWVSFLKSYVIGYINHHYYGKLMPSNGLQETNFVHPSFGKLLKDRRCLCLRHLGSMRIQPGGEGEVRSGPQKTRENNVGENMTPCIRGLGNPS